MKSKRRNDSHVFGIPVPARYVNLAAVLFLLVVGGKRWLNQHNWTLLENKQFGFAIQTPANWKRYTYGSSGLRGMREWKAQAFTNQFGPIGLKSKSLDVYWLPLEERSAEIIMDQDLMDWFTKQYNRDGIISEARTIQVGHDNYSTVTRTIRIYKKEVVQQYFINVDDGVYILEFYLRSEDSKGLSQIDSMLRTFQVERPIGGRP